MRWRRWSERGVEGGQLMKSTTVTSCKLPSRVVASCKLQVARCQLQVVLAFTWQSLFNAHKCKANLWTTVLGMPSDVGERQRYSTLQASAPGYTCCAVMPRCCASINLLHKLTCQMADGRHINDIVGHARHERCMRQARAIAMQSVRSNSNNHNSARRHQVSDLVHQHKLWHNHWGELSSPCAPPGKYFMRL